VVVGFNSATNLERGSGNIIIGAYCDVGTEANDALNIGNLIKGNMADGSKSVIVDGTLTINHLPTTDPKVVGQLWNDSGVLKVSAGAND
jgi:hypothetical protein